MKSIEEIKAKLIKLYAMMDENSGSCQQEIESAMKAARKLMAQYKLEERDFLGATEKKVIKKQLNIIFSNVVNPWRMTLNDIIAHNYCCHSVIYTTAGAKTKNLGLIGFEDDVEVAEKILETAINFVDKESNKYKKGITSAEFTSLRNALGNGFCKGIKEAFEEQNKTEDVESFAMVMVEPQEVKDVVSGLSKGHFNTSNATRKARQFDKYAVIGYMEGKKFNPSKMIA